MDGYESKRFQVGRYTAYVFYHLDGDCSVELEGDDSDIPAHVWDEAWDEAERLGLLDADSNGDFGDSI